jgi:choline dehydrogenase-like flavoprotein
VLQSYTGFGACYFGHTGATLEDARQLAWALRGRLHEPMDAPRIVRAAASAPAALAYLLGRRLDLRGRRTRFEVAAVIEPWPDPDNRVELLAETDRLGVPKVLVTWRRHEIERRTHRHAVDLVGRAIEAGGHGRMTIDPGVWEFDRWDRAVATTWHHMGTTRMGASACGGVVDTDCRVFGTSNLYVAGSSVSRPGAAARRPSP